MVNMVVSPRGPISADVVSDSCDTEAFTGNISMPACGFPVCLRLCGLAYGGNRLNRGCSQGKTLLRAVALYIIFNSHYSQYLLCMAGSKYYDGKGSFSR
ncbi:MAG: hypothetical protein ACYS80_27220 [Planctomycetota bacterium]